MASQRQFPESGPWRLIETDERGTTYWPRNPTRLARFEKLLPGGSVIIDDVHAGLVIVSEWYAKADLDQLRPIGRPLKDRGVMKRQQEDLPYFVFDFQEVYDSDDALQSRQLRLVTAYRGCQFLRQIELPPL